MDPAVVTTRKLFSSHGGSFVFLCHVFLMFSRLFIGALWLPAGKGLASWLLLVMFIVFLWYPGSGVVLDCIVS